MTTTRAANGAIHAFRRLCAGMLAMGLGIGSVFPLFVRAFGMPERIAASAPFVGATLTAGLIVGSLNFLLVDRIVRPRLRRLASGMEQVRDAMRRAMYDDNWSDCAPERCSVLENDADEIGTVARSYNALLQALHDAHQIENSIREFNRALSRRLDLQELGESALSMLRDFASADAGAIVLERHGEWTVLASQGLINPEGITTSPGFRAANQQHSQRRIVLPAGVDVDAVLVRFHPADVLLTPIIDHGLILGWLVLAAGEPLAAEAPRLLPLLMQGLGLAMNNALLHDDLQRVAALDALTGVYNRRFGLQRLEEEIARAERAQGPLALLMFDIDHFKRVNDTFGHLAGDKVLIRTAALCKSLLRDGDVLLRYGGEEFIAILPGAGPQDAAGLAERIRFAMARTEVESGDRVIQVTVSVGVVAATPPSGAEDLIAEADARLYRAKALGRDRVVAAAETRA